MCWHKSRWCLILCAHQSFLFYGSTFLTTRKFILFAKAASFTFLCKKSKKWKKKSIDVFKIESNCPIIYFSLSSNLKKKGRNPVRFSFFLVIGLTWLRRGELKTSVWPSESERRVGNWLESRSIGPRLRDERRENRFCIFRYLPWIFYLFYWLSFGCWTQVTPWS